MAVSYGGRQWSVWALLAEQLKKDGINPNDWVKRHPNAAKKMNLGLGPGGKVIRLDRRDAKIQKEIDDKAAEVALEDETTIGEGRDLIVRTLKKYIPGFDESLPENVALIDRLFGRVKNDIEDPNAITNAFLVDADIEKFLPGYKALAEAGVIPASGVGAGQAYWQWRSSVNETYELHFGTRLTGEQLTAIAKNVDTGGHSASFLETYYSFLDEVGDAFALHNGRAATNAELNALFQTGKSKETITAEYRGADFIKANRGSIQSEAGAFNFGEGGAGSGTFSEAELTALGNQEAGITTALGLDIQRRVSLATQRMDRIFQGQAAQGSLNLPGGATRGAPGSRVDVGV